MNKDLELREKADMDRSVVKALEWKATGPLTRVSRTPIGQYNLAHHMAIEWHAHLGTVPVGDGPYRSEEAAKAAAQRDYADRILAALDLSRVRRTVVEQCRRAVLLLIHTHGEPGAVAENPFVNAHDIERALRSLIDQTSIGEQSK